MRPQVLLVAEDHEFLLQTRRLHARVVIGTTMSLAS